MAASARDRYRLLEPNKSPNRKWHRRAVLQFCESTIVIDKHCRFGIIHRLSLYASLIRSIQPDGHMARSARGDAGVDENQDEYADSQRN
jgi:hypothetical protein